MSFIYWFEIELPLTFAKALGFGSIVPLSDNTCRLVVTSHSATTYVTPYYLIVQVARCASMDVQFASFVTQDYPMIMNFKIGKRDTQRSLDCTSLIDCLQKLMNQYLATNPNGSWANRRNVEFTISYESKAIGLLETLTPTAQDGRDMSLEQFAARVGLQMLAYGESNLYRAVHVEHGDLHKSFDLKDFFSFCAAYFKPDGQRNFQVTFLFPANNEGLIYLAKERMLLGLLGYRDSYPTKVVHDTVFWSVTPNCYAMFLSLIQLAQFFERHEVNHTLLLIPRISKTPQSLKSIMTVLLDKIKRINSDTGTAKKPVTKSLKLVYYPETASDNWFKTLQRSFRVDSSEKKDVYNITVNVPVQYNSDKWFAYKLLTSFFAEDNSDSLVTASSWMYNAIIAQTEEQLEEKGSVLGSFIFYELANLESCRMPGPPKPSL